MDQGHQTIEAKKKIICSQPWKWEHFVVRIASPLSKLLHYELQTVIAKATLDMNCISFKHSKSDKIRKGLRANHL